MPKYLYTKEEVTKQEYLIEAPDEATARNIAVYGEIEYEYLDAEPFNSVNNGKRIGTILDRGGSNRSKTTVVELNEQETDSVATKSE